MSKSGMLLLALFFAGQADARGAVRSFNPMTPELTKPSKSYTTDDRPVVDKNILNKLKSKDQPYPALQSTNKYESDFIKDENNDAGHWKAQFEYDALRKKILAEKAQEKAAADAASKEGSDVDAAQKKSDAAAKAADAAKKDADAAKAEEAAAKDGAKKKDMKAPSKEEQAAMEKKVAKAEEKYEDQKKAFAECQKELDDAKKKYEELKAKMDAMDKAGAANVAMWAEQMESNRKASEAAMVEAKSKRQAAEKVLAEAQSKKTDMEVALAKEKFESEQAKKKLQKEKAEKEQVRTDLAKATEHLRKLKGYAAPTKSSAQTSAFSAVVLSLLLLLSK